MAINKREIIKIVTDQLFNSDFSRIDWKTSIIVEITDRRVETRIEEKNVPSSSSTPHSGAPQLKKR